MIFINTKAKVKGNGFLTGKYGFRCDTFMKVQMILSTPKNTFAQGDK